MKKILLSLLLVLVYVIPAWSQTIPVFTESCTLTAAAPNCTLRNEEGQGIGAHVTSWTLNGTNSGSTILLRYSDDGVNFSTLITGTSTSSNESAVTNGTYRFWKFTLSGFTATSTGASVTAVHKAYNFTPGTASIGSVVIDQGTPGTTNGVYVTNLTTDTADNAPFTENPVGVGGAYIAAPADHTTGDKAVLLTDIKGNLSISPFPVGTTSFKCTITSAMTGTTSTVCGAAVSSNYIYLTRCTASNGSTTVSTDILLQDGSGGTTIDIIPAAAASVATTGGGGAIVTYGTPLKVTTLGNALYVANVTTSSATKVSCNGFASPVSY
jgi:hypothetical protein